MLTIEEASKWLLARDNFLILSHKSPDGDTIGSGAALCIALREQGKTAFMLKNDDISENFAPFAENLQSEDFEADFVVSVDIATEGLFPKNAEKYKGEVDLSIDHHPPRELFGKENCVHHEKAAAGEIIYGIVSLWGPLTQAVARPLYLAISTDTGCFVYGNTTAETHHVAAAIMETGLEVRQINKVLFQTVTLTRLKVESMLVANMKMYNNGTVAMVCVTRKLVEELQATPKDMDDIASFLSKVEGVKVAATIREKENNICKLSLRTDPNVLKADEACALLGGGGHAAASGASMDKPLEEAISAVTSAIEQVLGSKLVPVSE